MPASFSALQRAEIAEMRLRRCGPPVPIAVSVLFNEPKLLKYSSAFCLTSSNDNRFSALQRAEIAEIEQREAQERVRAEVSVLFNEPKLLKCVVVAEYARPRGVSVLFNEPKLLKWLQTREPSRAQREFQCSSTSRNC